MAITSPHPLDACDICGLVQHLPALEPGQEARCHRCSTRLRRRKTNSIQRTVALTLAALVLYIPANVYPVMTLRQMGYEQSDTILSGVVALIKAGSPEIAVLIFLCSIAIPLLKLLGLLYLSLAVSRGHARSLRGRTFLYKTIEVIGRWSMLDVFLLSILVALVKLGSFATITPGPGIIAFAAVVVLTLLASASFDPRLLWDPLEDDS